MHSSICASARSILLHCRARQTQQLNIVTSLKEVMGRSMTAHELPSRLASLWALMSAWVVSEIPSWKAFCSNRIVYGFQNIHIILFTNVSIRLSFIASPAQTVGPMTLNFCMGIIIWCQTALIGSFPTHVTASILWQQASWKLATALLVLVPLSVCTS